MAQFLKTVLLFALLVIVGLRPLIHETHDTQLEPFAQALSDLPPAGPLPTLWIDLVIVAAFGLTWALRRNGELPQARSSGLVPGCVVVVLAAVAACFVASNKRLAINATLDWLTLLLLAIALSRLLQKTSQIRLCLCVIIASGIASAIESFDDYFVVQPDTIAMYEQDKESLWEEEGLPENSYQVELLERRIYDRAAKGFFYLSNIAGNYFVLVVFAALSLVACVWRGRPALPRRVSGTAFRSRESAERVINVALLLVLVAVMTSALLLTKSRGALAAVAIGLAAALVLWIARATIRSNRRKALWVGWLIVGLCAAAVSFYGFTRGGLPGGSLTYRWWYLEATVGMVKDHPLLGVGTAQYGRYYPRYKEIKSPEEISNPHNFLATAAAEWGIPGLIGVILMLVGGSRVVAGITTRGSCEANPESPVTSHESRSQHSALSTQHLATWGVCLVGAIWILRICIVGSDDLNYIVASNAYPLIGWIVAFVICAMTLREDEAATTEMVGSAHPVPARRDRLPTADCRLIPSAHPACLWLAVGLFAFLVHELINFALFVPGSATTFFALFAVCVAARHEENSSFRNLSSEASAKGDPQSATRAAQRSAASQGGVHNRRRPLLLSPIALATLIAVTFLYRFSIQPVALCWRELQYARRFLAYEPMHKYYWGAHQADPLDPTGPREAAELFLRRRQLESVGSSLTPMEIEDFAQVAAKRDPENVGVHRLLAALYLAWSEFAANEVLQAARYYEKVLQLYPTNPNDRIRMAEIQSRVYNVSGRTEMLDRAIAELKTALELDRRRPGADEVRRFSAEKRAHLQAEIERLRGKAESRKPKAEIREEKP